MYLESNILDIQLIPLDQVTYIIYIKQPMLHGIKIPYMGIIIPYMNIMIPYMDMRAAWCDAVSFFIQLFSDRHSHLVSVK